MVLCGGACAGCIGKVSRIFSLYIISGVLKYLPLGCVGVGLTQQLETHGGPEGRVEVVGPLAMSIAGLQLSTFTLHPVNEVVLAEFLLTCCFSPSRARGIAAVPTLPHPGRSSAIPLLRHFSCTPGLQGLVTPAVSCVRGQWCSVGWGCSSRRDVAESKCPT